MKLTSRGLAPSLITGLSTFTGARQRLAVALVAIVIAFAGAQTAGAQEEHIPCFVKFDIRGEGKVVVAGETVEDGDIIVCNIRSNIDLTITPETGYFVSIVTCDATDGLSNELHQDDDFQWSLHILSYQGSETPTITVHIVFDDALAGGAFVKFDISGEGTVEFDGGSVTNRQTINYLIPLHIYLTITPETGYVVSSVTCNGTFGLDIELQQEYDFQWSLSIHPYEGSETPTITVHIVFDKALAGGADEASAVALTADDDLSHLAGGWYKVESDLAFGHTVILHGDTHITIATGATLTVSTSDEYGIYGSALTVSGEGTLAVSASKRAIYVDNYTQTGCAVTLSGNYHGLHAKNNVSISGGSLTTSGANNGIESNQGAITISGGTVSSSGKQCGLYATKAMNITGGTVSASGNNYGIRGYSVSITGGQVTASSGGITSIFGDITLGWTSDTDYITASGYVLKKDGKHVKIADGQKLYGDSGFPTISFTGTIDDPSVLNGLTLRPVADVTESGTNEYTIWNAAGWDAFCDALQDNDTWNRFTGKTVKLADGISVTQSAGGEGHEFMGTFDGDGKTLTVNITDTENQGTAPFRFISNATIRNLHVTGSVTGTAHASGLVGKASAGTILIENCLVEANVNSTVGDTNGNKHCGGIVGHGFGGNNPVSLTLRNCVYAGTITCDKNFIGGLQGWSDGNTLTLENCLFAGNYQGTEAGTAAFHPIALHNTGSATNLTATNVFAAVAPTATNADFIAADGTKTTGRTSAPANLGTQGATYNYMNMTVYEHGLYYDGLYYVAPTLSTDSDNAYLINNEDDWTNFCDALYNNGTWNRFSGKTVKLGANIGTAQNPVTRMAGSADHDFCGTFDGQGHTLTFTSNENIDGVAPFSYVSETTPTGGTEVSHPVIRNLNVVADINTTAQYASALVGRMWCTLTIEGCTVGGTIQTSDKYAAGFIAQQNGDASITDCRSSVTIKSSVEGDGTHGGFVAVPGGTLNITGCVFDGKLLTTNSTIKCGGFVGWSGSNTVNITNSLYAPATPTNSEKWVGTSGSATFARNGATISNCYYTQDFNDGTNNTGQGKQLRTIAAGEGVTIGHAGVATEYSVSGITAYKASDACGDSDPFIAGIIYNNVLYAGSGDEVSLTLANSGGEAPLGYKNGDYIITGGATLSGSKLIMSDDNVTISFTPGDLRSTGEAVLVSYINAAGILCDGQDGRPDPANAIALDGTEGILVAGWYFVGADINYSGQINCFGNVNIILADGKTMTVTNDVKGIYGDDGSLTIYGQTLGTGTLDVTSEYDHGIYASGDVTITGGQVTATSEYSTGIYAESGNITITGGQVTSTGTTGIYANYGDITISGGQVTATGNLTGIYSQNGDITLGCTKATDYITASSYEFGPEGRHLLNIWSPLYDEDGNEYSGDVFDYFDLAGKTLRPLPNVLALDDAADNSAAITANDRETRNVILYGRTLYKDGAWNTLCLPFALTDEQIAASPLAGADIRALSTTIEHEGAATGFNPQTGTLTLNFTPAAPVSGAVNAIEAGVPYIVKWGNTEGTEPTEGTEHIVNPVFSGVTVSSTAPADRAVTSTDGYVTFVGTYAKKEYAQENQSILFLGTGNNLYYPQPSDGKLPTIGAFRAYFSLVPPEPGSAQVRAFVLNFGDASESQGIKEIEDGRLKIENEAGAWYDLQGRRMESSIFNSQSSIKKKGLYIHGGRKVVVK